MNYFSPTPFTFIVSIALLKKGVDYILKTTFDYVIFGLMYENIRLYNLFIVGIPLANITYFVFNWIIVKYNIPTPRREEGSLEFFSLLADEKYDEVAEIVIEGLGGRDNTI